VNTYRDRKRSEGGRVGVGREKMQVLANGEGGNWERETRRIGKSVTGETILSGRGRKDEDLDGVRVSGRKRLKKGMEKGLRP
jgi:hypothetical protein